MSPPVAPRLSPEDAAYAKARDAFDKAQPRAGRHTPPWQSPTLMALHRASEQAHHARMRTARPHLARWSELALAQGWPRVEVDAAREAIDRARPPMRVVAVARDHLELEATDPTTGVVARTTRLRDRSAGVSMSVVAASAASDDGSVYCASHGGRCQRPVLGGLCTVGRWMQEHVVFERCACGLDRLFHLRHAGCDHRYGVYNCQPLGRVHEYGCTLNGIAVAQLAASSSPAPKQLSAEEQDKAARKQRAEDQRKSRDEANADARERQKRLF